MKKLFNVILFLSMLSLTIVACSGNTNKPESAGNAPNVNDPNNNVEIDIDAKYDPPIKMTVGFGRMDADVNLPAGETADNGMWSKIINDELGIELVAKYGMAKGAELDQKINALIVTNDLPDTFNVDGKLTNRQYDQLIEAGMIEDLTDLFEKHASPLVKSILTAEMLEPTLRNGRMYGIPMLVDTREDGYMLWIRTDWLKKLNIPEPETMQDVLSIAESFIAMDPGNNYGITSGNTLSTAFDLAGFFAAYHAYPNIWVKDENDNLSYGAIQPEMRTALEQLQQYNKKGLLSKEWAIATSGQRHEDLINGRVGINYGKWYASEYPLQKVRDYDKNAEWKAFPFVSSDDKPALSAIGGLKVSNYFVIKKGHEHPESIIKMLNLVVDKYFGEDPIVDPTGSNLWKVSPVFSQPADKNLRLYHEINKAIDTGDISELTAEGKERYEDIMDYYENGNQDHWGFAVQYAKGNTIEENSGALGLHDFYTDNNRWIVDEFYGAPTASMPMKQANLDKLLTETVINIIEGADITTFDSFVEQWKSQGGDDITKEVNDWYNNK